MGVLKDLIFLVNLVLMEQLLIIEKKSDETKL